MTSVCGLVEQRLIHEHELFDRQTKHVCYSIQTKLATPGNRLGLTKAEASEF